jgi:8-oxo-dGTP pyrophosphatase MutT (NUDIX family)
MINGLFVQVTIPMAAALEPIPQVAAVPVRRGRICLITSRNGKRWVIPKGCMEPGKTADQIALQEAWEEGGLVGVLLKEPVGSYLYEKSGHTYHVTVFLMHVTWAAARWPEGTQRRRSWFHAAEAGHYIEHPGLRKLIGQIAVTEEVTLPA